MITSRFTGTDANGYQHTAVIVSRGDNERYVECGSCDYQRRVSWGARETAESHLWSEHHVSGVHRQLALGPFIAAGFGLLLVLFLLSKAHAL
ncbi:hypothetical protein ACFV1W_23490 [Kitasatospora sp. NPDC059648]|uniref:hypothetical protein n=1 Tax=Kitasatospora sp. NPDC059648 TaxID=3346894 RepID=UPI0036C9CC30